MMVFVVCLCRAMYVVGARRSIYVFVVALSLSFVREKSLYTCRIRHPNFLSICVIK